MKGSPAKLFQKMPMLLHPLIIRMKGEVASAFFAESSMIMQTTGKRGVVLKSTLIGFVSYLIY